MDPTQLGIVDPDDSLQALIARIARDTIASCELRCGFTIDEIENVDELDILVYNICVGFDKVESWRKANPSTKLILLIETAEAETWTRIERLNPVAVLSIPFRYQELRSALS